MNKANKMERNGMFFSIIIGIVVDVILCTVLAMIMPIFILNDSLPVNAMPILVISTHTLCCFVGASVSGHMQNDKKWIAGVGSAAAYLILLLLCNMLIFYRISDYAYLDALGCLIGSALAVFVQIIKKPVIKKGRKRARSR